VADQMRGQVVHHNTTFQALPSNWDALSNFTISSGRLLPTGPGSLTDYARTADYQEHDYQETTFQFDILDVNCVFGLAWWQQSYPGQFKGMVLLFDGTAGASACVIKAAKFDGSTALSGFRTFTIPWTVAAGRHTLRFGKRRNQRIFTFADQRQNKFSQPMEMNNSFDIAYAYGKIGIINVSGDSTKWKGVAFRHAGLCQSSPHLAILGDSISSNSGGVMSGLGDALWTREIDRRRGKGDMMLTAMGGETSAGALARFDGEFRNFTPKNWLLAYWQNDYPGTLAAWRTNIQALITKIITKTPNAQIYMTTVTPNPAAQSSVDTRNADIRGGYFDATAGFPIRVIEFTKRLTAAGDDTAWNLANSFDTIHLTPAGNQIMADAVEADAPELIHG